MVATIGRVSASRCAKAGAIRIDLVLSTEIALLAGACVQRTVPTMGSQLTTGQAGTVAAVVLAVIASFAGSSVLDAIAAVRGKATIHSATAVGTRVAGCAQVTLFSRV